MARQKENKKSSSQSVGGKHAYLIIAHNEPEILAILVRMLDDVRNDIFIHVDAKVKNIQPFKDAVSTNHSKIEFLEKRVRTEWGHASQIMCEYALLEAAHNVMHYAYYHLLSGVDLPIKTQSQIHAFFDSIQGKELVGFAKGIRAEEDIAFKTRYYHFFCNWKKGHGIVCKCISLLFNSMSLPIQRILKLHRNKGYEYRKGCNWISITDGLVAHLLSEKAGIIKRYKYTFCSDELFVQTALWHSPLKKNIYGYDLPEFDGCKRLIDWNRGCPYCWKMSDFEELKQSDKLFARKFSSKDMDVVRALEQHIKNMQ